MPGCLNSRVLFSPLSFISFHHLSVQHVPASIILILIVEPLTQKAFTNSFNWDTRSPILNRPETIISTCRIEPRFLQKVRPLTMPDRYRIWQGNCSACNMMQRPFILAFSVSAHREQSYAKNKMCGELLGGYDPEIQGITDGLLTSALKLMDFLT